MFYINLDIFNNIYVVYFLLFNVHFLKNEIRKVSGFCL